MFLLIAILALQTIDAKASPQEKAHRYHDLGYEAFQQGRMRVAEAFFKQARAEVPEDHRPLRYQHRKEIWVRDDRYPVLKYVDQRVQVDYRPNHWLAQVRRSIPPRPSLFFIEQRDTHKRKVRIFLHNRGHSDLEQFQVSVHEQGRVVAHATWPSVGPNQTVRTILSLPLGRKLTLHSAEQFGYQLPPMRLANPIWSSASAQTQASPASASAQPQPRRAQ